MTGPRAEVVRLQAAPSDDARPHVRRLTAEIAIAGRTELVAVLEDERGVRAVASDGTTEGPFVDAALELFGSIFARRASERPEPGVSERPEVPSLRLELKAAVEEVVTAAVRAGIDAAKQAPALKLALDTLVKITERARAPGLERFVGRLRNAVEFGDVEECAMLLGGATQLVADLAEEDPSPPAVDRIAGWIDLPGAGPREAPLYEHDFVELGREWVAGTTRASIQRRYLVDLADGEVYREVVRAGRPGSVGPSPRFVHAGLALRATGTVPRRLRLLQYEIAPRVPEHAKDALVAHACRRVEDVVERFRAAHASAPGQAEPFVLFAPEDLVSRDGAVALLDEAGVPFPLAASEGLELDTSLLRELGGARPRLVAGRVLLSAGALILRPFAILTGEGSAARLVRLR